MKKAPKNKSGWKFTGSAVFPMKNYDEKALKRAVNFVHQGLLEKAKTLRYDVEIIHVKGVGDHLVVECRSDVDLPDGQLLGKYIAKVYQAIGAVAMKALLKLEGIELE
jgi:hypothetical protein